jgi:hypothetical protein
VSPDPVLVFVNARRLELPAGATVLDAVRAWSADAARDVEAGARVVTDSRGLPTAADAPVYAGAIFRLTTARGARSADAGDELDGAE